MRMRHVLSMNDFTREDIMAVITGADRYTGKISKLSEETQTGTLFFAEPSTRTAKSFHTVFTKLGIAPYIEKSLIDTSMTKGESIYRTAKTFALNGDSVIVIRTKIDGAQRFIAEKFKNKNFPVSIINAGDGQNEHPTQALGDLRTVYKKFGRIDGLKIGMFGDLKHSRVPHSDAIALSRFKKVELHLACDSSVSMPEQYKRLFPERLKESDDMSILHDCHAIIGNRVQKERFGHDQLSLQRALGKYQVNKENIKNFLKEAIFLPPQPFNNEFPPDLENHPQLFLEEEVINCLLVRMYLVAEGWKARNENSLALAEKKGKVTPQQAISQVDYLKQKRKEGKEKNLTLPLETGTIIDHVPAGLGVMFRSFLTSHGVNGGTWNLIENATSAKKEKLKDMLLLKNSFVPDELMIAMKSLAPSVEFSIAQDGNWIKLNVEAPGTIYGLGKCLNGNCITNDCSGECQTNFSHESGYLHCLYCNNEFTLKEILT